MRFSVMPLILLAFALTGCEQKRVAPSPPAAAAEPVAEKRETTNADLSQAPLDVPRAAVTHQPTLEKILGNGGISLQWISWNADERGTLQARYRNKELLLRGTQQVENKNGKLSLIGYVTKVDEGSFILRGTITITDTPDTGRNCKKEGEHNFAITQNRKYFRLREFEWCDGLTDYVDIYF